MNRARPSPLPPLQIGRVIGDTFAVLRRGWLVILPLALLLEWAPNVAQGLMYEALPEAALGGRYGAAAVSMAWWLLFPLADMAVVAAALAVLDGRRPSFASSVAVALRVYPAAFVLDVLQNLVSLAEPWLLNGLRPGSVANAAQVIEIVYGIASAAILLPSLAAAAHERLSPPAALARTASLTAGNRLRVAILAGLFLVAQLLLAPLIQALMAAMLGAGAAALALSYLPHTLIFCFASPAQATLYWRLARLRDGAAPGEVDDIFG